MGANVSPSSVPFPAAFLDPRRHTAPVFTSYTLAYAAVLATVVTIGSNCLCEPDGALSAD